MSARVLIVAEHDGELLNPSTSRCVTCAGKILGAEVDVLVCAVSAERVATQASRISGVSRVLTIEHPMNEHPIAAVLAPQIVFASMPYSHVFGPSNTFGKDVMPRVAAQLDVPQISDIMAVEGPARFRRPIHAGNVIVTLEMEGTGKIVGTVRTASFDAAGATGSASIEPLTVQAAIPLDTQWISATRSRGGTLDLQTARRVVSGGRALGSAENFEILRRLAGTLGAAVGASRAAVDSGYASNDLQVGQTGKIIAPELYVAVGISGAIQHLTGIKDARTIVAINKDPAAPIFDVADIGLVGDLFQVMPELERILGNTE
jgi:electron transfer flavoprotein alpha subunit